jgi:3-hydroxybutyryl-CoA dehydrogenase
MYNRGPESSARAVREIEASLQALIASGVMSQERAEAARARIDPTTELARAVEGADYVVEAVAERLPLKREIFARLDALCPPPAILATTTSTFRVSEIVGGLDHPERTIATHYYTPPPLVPVVEVARGPRTSPGTLQVTLALLRSLGKEPIEIRESRGHIGVRLTTALRREAISIVEQGIATPEAVDAVLKSVSRLFPTVGILELCDLSGLDVMLDVHRSLQGEIDARPDPSPLLIQKVGSGELGLKTGKGFYAWSPERVAQVRARRARELARWFRDRREEPAEG